MSIPYYLCSAQVVSTDPENHAVYVQFTQQGNEQPTLPARVLVKGPMDGLRAHLEPLPTKGTIGLVCAANGDPRSLIWIGSIAANGQDAISPGPGEDFKKFHSHWSGYLDQMDDHGNSAQQWPDGTLITVGTPGAPTVFGHRVASGGTRQRVPLPLSSRVSGSPAAFPIEVNHSSGTKVHIDGTGNVSVTGVANMAIAVPSGTVDIRAPNITIGGLAETVRRLVNEIGLATYNSHTHGGILPGGSNTSVPNELMAIGTDTTSITYAG